MRLAHQLTQLGQKKHVECLMKAYKRIVVQKGLFHQGMHQVCVIYSLYYGGFLQCLACVRYMMRMFMKATILENLLFIEGEDPSAYLKVRPQPEERHLDDRYSPSHRRNSQRDERFAISRLRVDR